MAASSHRVALEHQPSRRTKNRRRQHDSNSVSISGLWTPSLSQVERTAPLERSERERESWNERERERECVSSSLCLLRRGPCSLPDEQTNDRSTAPAIPGLRVVRSILPPLHMQRGVSMRAVLYLVVVAVLAVSRPDGALAQVEPIDPNLPVTPSLSPSATPSPSPSSFSPSPSPSASASATPSPSPTSKKPRTPPPGADGSDGTNANGVNNNNGANTPPPSPTTKPPKPTAAQPQPVNEAGNRAGVPTSVPPEIAVDRSARAEYGTKVPSSKEQAAQSGAAQDDSISKLGSWLVPTVIGAVIVSALIVVTFFVQKRKQNGHGSPRRSDMFFRASTHKHEPVHAFGHLDGGALGIRSECPRALVRRARASAQRASRAVAAGHRGRESVRPAASGRVAFYRLDEDDSDDRVVVTLLSRLKLSVCDFHDRRPVTTRFLSSYPSSCEEY
ncbi:hypothetical protein PINS_up009026 [Pythium insidiosum]|nr:hypothetical protein PINS_up009026 [Pythium insidiosum]